jgi:hypothetical protein
MKTCSVDDCAKPAEKRGWCAMHYRRWRVHGDLTTTLKAANGVGYKQGGYLGHQVNGARKFDHVLIAERALGKPLPTGAVVHHWDEDRTNNAPENLLICPDRAYHNLIHARMSAMAATGDPSKRPCRRCKQYDALENLRNYQTKAGGWAHWHPKCENLAAAKARNEAKK